MTTIMLPLQAIRLLNETADKLPLRSIERDIVICALLYLKGDTEPGHSVERWWKSQTGVAA